MNSLRHAYAILGMLTILAAAGIGSSHHSATVRINPQAVNVVNTTSNPVPTSAQGTTQVAGNVSASQSGAWSVGVSNTTSNPVPVQDMGESQRTPIRISGGVSIVNAVTGLSTMYQVPSNKVLVIESIGMHGLALVPAFNVDVVISDSNNIFELATASFSVGQPVATGSDYRYGESHSVVLFAGPNENVDFRAGINGPSNGTFSATFSGYLMPAGSVVTSVQQQGTPQLLRPEPAAH